MVQLSHLYMTTGKTIAFIWIFVSKVMSLLFNTVSKFVIAFLPRSKRLLISWLQSMFTVILEPKKRKSVTVSTFSPSVCYEVMGPDAMILVFWMLSFKPALSVSSFTFIKRFFSSVLPLGLSHLHMWGYWYFSCQSWFQLLSHPAQHFTWCTLHRSLKKQGDNSLPWHTPFPILDQSIIPCPVLTVASWPTYRFLGIHLRWSSLPMSLRIFYSQRL